MSGLKETLTLIGVLLALTVALFIIHATDPQHCHDDECKIGASIVRDTP